MVLFNLTRKSTHKQLLLEPILPEISIIPSKEMQNVNKIEEVINLSKNKLYMMDITFNISLPIVN